MGFCQAEACLTFMSLMIDYALVGGLEFGVKIRARVLQRLGQKERKSGIIT